MATQGFIAFARAGIDLSKRDDKDQVFFGRRKSAETLQREAAQARYEGRGNRCPECGEARAANGACWC